VRAKIRRWIRHEPTACCGWMMFVMALLCSGKECSVRHQIDWKCDSHPSRLRSFLAAGGKQGSAKRSGTAPPRTARATALPFQRCRRVDGVGLADSQRTMNGNGPASVNPAEARSEFQLRPVFYPASFDACHRFSSEQLSRPASSNFPD